MKLKVNWVMPFAVAGTGAQFLWLQSVPSLSEHAVGVAIATAASCLLALRVTERVGAMQTRWWVVVLVCVISGTIAALTSFWLLEFIRRPAAVENSLVRNTVPVMAMTALMTGGWFVGLALGLAQCLRTVAARAP
jgi:hypothetical protein